MIKKSNPKESSGTCKDVPITVKDVIRIDISVKTSTSFTANSLGVVTVGEIIKNNTKDDEKESKPEISFVKEGIADNSFSGFNKDALIFENTNNKHKNGKNGGCDGESAIDV